LARREVGRSLALPEARLSIGRRGRIPILELDGRPTALALSLSHHGRWIAYAMTPGIDVATQRIGSGRVPTADRVGIGNDDGSGATNWQTP
jgi:phosphopantetheinyl transferase